MLPGDMFSNSISPRIMNQSNKSAVGEVSAEFEIPWLLKRVMTQGLLDI